MFKPLFDINVAEISKARDLRCDFGLIELPVILLRKPNHIPSIKYLDSNEKFYKFTLPP
jgi:hypothetical protein